MPLDRAHVTVASRVMLPTYPMLAGVLGAGFLFTPEPILLETPIYRSMAHLAPLHFWGAGLLLIAAIQLVALALYQRRGRGLYQYALGLLAVWMAAWAGVCVVAYFGGEASPVAWVWPAFAARCCWASMLSLAAREA